MLQQQFLKQPAEVEVLALKQKVTALGEAMVTMRQEAQEKGTEIAQLNQENDAEIAQLKQKQDAEIAQLKQEKDQEITQIWAAIKAMQGATE